MGAFSLSKSPSTDDARQKIISYLYAFYLKSPTARETLEDIPSLGVLNIAGTTAQGSGVLEGRGRRGFGGVAALRAANDDGWAEALAA